MKSEETKERLVFQHHQASNSISSKKIKIVNGRHFNTFLPWLPDSADLKLSG